MLVMEDEQHTISNIHNNMLATSLLNDIKKEDETTELYFDEHFNVSFGSNASSNLTNGGVESCGLGTSADVEYLQQQNSNMVLPPPPFVLNFGGSNREMVGARRKANKPMLLPLLQMQMTAKKQPPKPPPGVMEKLLLLYHGIGFSPRHIQMRYGRKYHLKTEEILRAAVNLSPALLCSWKYNPKLKECFLKCPPEFVFQDALVRFEVAFSDYEKSYHWMPSLSIPLEYRQDAKLVADNFFSSNCNNVQHKNQIGQVIESLLVDPLAISDIRSGAIGEEHEEKTVNINTDVIVEHDVSGVDKHLFANAEIAGNADCGQSLESTLNKATQIKLKRKPQQLQQKQSKKMELRRRPAKKATNCCMAIEGSDPQQPSTSSFVQILEEEQQSSSTSVDFVSGSDCSVVDAQSVNTKESKKSSIWHDFTEYYAIDANGKPLGIARYLIPMTNTTAARSGSYRIESMLNANGEIVNVFCGSVVRQEHF